MNRLAHLALLAALAAGSAAAQELGAYRALAQHLDAAAANAASGERALSALDQAETAYGRLAPTLQNKQLLAGLRGTLDGARAALARTPAEVQAQVLLARGLMRKALYDQTLNRLAQSPAGDSASQVTLLAREFGLNGAPAQALQRDARAGHLERVAWRLQRAGTQKVAAALTALRPERSPGAYLNLARATSWFTAVQDAGSDLRVSGFTDALGQLTAGDLPALKTSLTTLRRETAALNRALAAPPAATSPAAPPSPAVTGAQAVTPAVTTPAAAGPVAAAGGLDAAYASLGRALTAAGHGDPETARLELTRVPAALASAPAALRQSGALDAFDQHLAAAQERRGLRPGDVEALIAELNNLERQAEGQARSMVDTLSARVAATFSGGLRAVTFLLLALLALLPLYLLNLAFGGRNPYWRAITAALGLLLLPVFLEGVFGFLGWLGDLGGVGLLRAAPNLTLWQGVYGLPLRALFTALAIALAAYGFRGLCVQFGLLGRQSALVPATQPSLDWDEEV